MKQKWPEKYRWLMAGVSVVAALGFLIGFGSSIETGERLQSARTEQLTLDSLTLLPMASDGAVLVGERADCLVVVRSDPQAATPNVMAVGIREAAPALLEARDLEECGVPATFPWPYAVHPDGRLAAVLVNDRVLVISLTPPRSGYSFPMKRQVELIALAGISNAVLTVVSSDPKSPDALVERFELPDPGASLRKLDLEPAWEASGPGPGNESRVQRTENFLTWQTTTGEFVILNVYEAEPPTVVPPDIRLPFPTRNPFVFACNALVVADGQQLVVIDGSDHPPIATMPSNILSVTCSYPHHYYVAGEFGAVRINKNNHDEQTELTRASVEQIVSGRSGVAYISGTELTVIPLKYEARLNRSRMGFAIGIPLLLVGVTFGWFRYRVLTRELRDTRAAIKNISESEGLEKQILARAEAAKLQLESNTRHRYRLTSFGIDEFLIFRRFRWNLSPGINVLLGKNGYGKSLLFRTAVGMLWNDWESLMRSTREAADASIRLEILADGETRTIRSVSGELTSELGRMPVLAIPDARFIDRTGETVSPPPDTIADLIRSAAEVFLSGQPFDVVINAFLYDLCYDYRTLGGFNRAPFPLLARVVSDLTEDEFTFHSIERHSGGAKFTIKVTVGSVAAKPVPIQIASQGTLSILAVFGLVYRFLRTVWQDDSDELVNRPAVVFIDELDAHLHPSWQQKVIRMLRTTFPNVQFIISAHSPVIAAGCLKGEVAVLRKESDGFTLQEIEQDLIGSRSIELYKLLFEIDDIDEPLQYYSFQQDRKEKLDRRILELRRCAESGNVSQDVHADLDRLTRERALLQHAQEARERFEAPNEEVAELRARVRSLQIELDKRES